MSEMVFINIKELVFYIGFNNLEQIKDILQIILNIKKNTQPDVIVTVYFSVSLQYLQSNFIINEILSRIEILTNFQIDLNDVLITSDAHRILYIYCHGQDTISFPVFEAFIMKENEEPTLKKYCNNVVLQEQQNPFLVSRYTGLTFSETPRFYTIIILCSCLTKGFFKNENIPEKVICFQKKERCKIGLVDNFFQMKEEHCTTMTTIDIDESVEIIYKHPHDFTDVTFCFPIIDSVERKPKDENSEDENSEDDYPDYPDVSDGEFSDVSDVEEERGGKFIKINKKKKFYKKKTYKKKKF